MKVKHVGNWPTKKNNPLRFTEGVAQVCEKKYLDSDS